MASIKKKVRDRQATFIYELPYSITREICQNLDIDRAWERLASEIGYTNQEVNIFELALTKVNDSPTKQILSDWGARNPTARDLYNILQKINRRRETQILEAWFNSENGRGVHHQASTKPLTSMSHPPTDTPSMVLRVLEDAPLPKPPGKGGKSSKNSTGYSTSSMNNSSMSSNGNVNLNHPDNPKVSLSKKHIGGKDVNSFGKGYDEKFLPTKGDYLNKMKETMGMPGKGKDKLGEQHGSLSSSPSIHEDRIEHEGPAESKGNMATEKMVDNSWMETLKNQEGYNTLAKEGMCELEIAVALIGTQSFTYKELNQATNGFSEEYKIGEGAFGEVYRGTLKNTKCAIKKLYMKQECNDESHNVQGHLKSELKTLIRYRHENIVPLYGYTLDGAEICLVYQYMQSGSVEDKLKRKGAGRPLTWSQRLSIMRGAACGLQYLHTLDAKPLIHGDIKSGNILLDKHLEAKIGDLGLAQHATGGTGTKKLTHITKKQAHSKQYQCMAYLPPEAQRGTQMSVKGDTFSFGVVMLEIFTGELAYDEKREGEKFLCSMMEAMVGDDIGKCLGQSDRSAGVCPDHTLTEFYSIAHRCTQSKKKDRPDMVDVYEELELLEQKLEGSETLGQEKLTSGNMTMMDQISFESTGHYTPGLMAAQPQGHVTSMDTPHHVTTPCSDTPPALQSLPPGYPIPEAIRMQMMYDSRKVDSDVTCYPSDPHKISEMMKFDDIVSQENKEHQYVNMGSSVQYKRSESVERVIDELDKVKLDIEHPVNSPQNSSDVSSLPSANPSMPCGNPSIQCAEFITPDAEQTPDCVDDESCRTEMEAGELIGAGVETAGRPEGGSVVNNGGGSKFDSGPVKKTELGMNSFFARYEELMKEEFEEEEDCDGEGEDYVDEDYEEENYDEDDLENAEGDVDNDEAVEDDHTHVYTEQDREDISGTVVVGNETLEEEAQSLLSNNSALFGEGDSACLPHDTVQTTFHPCPIETCESVEEDCSIDQNDAGIYGNEDLTEDGLYGNNDQIHGDLYDNEGESVRENDLFSKDSVHQRDIVSVDINTIEMQHKFLKERRTPESMEGECFV